MNIIIPMAGRGSRLRPHTLTVPKPLLPVAGKPMVQHLVEDIVAMSDQKIDNICFVIGDFGDQVEQDLMAVAKELNAQGHIRYQDQPLGTAHAILCGKEFLTGNVIIAFADTLFRADFKLDLSKDGIIYVKQVADPSAFGVIKLDEENNISDFIEKPSTFVSDLAIIGIYFIKEGERIGAEMQYLIDNDLKEKGEYQLTNALENMKSKGAIFAPGEVKDWMDCGNKQNLLDTNYKMLNYLADAIQEEPSLKKKNSIIIQPCIIGKNTEIKNSIIGPHVSIGENCTIIDSNLSNSIIQSNSQIKSKVLENSLIGNNVTIEGKKADLSLGDFTSHYE